MERSPKGGGGGWELVVHITVAVAEGGSILVFQTVSPTRKAVVADRHNPIAVITLSLTLLDLRMSGSAGLKVYRTILGLESRHMKRLAGCRFQRTQ